MHVVVLLAVVMAWSYVAESGASAAVGVELACSELAERARIDAGRPVVCDSAGKVVRRDR